MRRCLVISATTFLVLGVLQGAMAQTGHDDSVGQPKPSWFQRLWPFHKKKAPEPVPTAKNNLKENAAARQLHEKADYLRRIAVCDKLRDIAFQTHDEELSRKADQLDQRAYAIFMNHTAQGDAASGVRMANGMQADERILERRLGQNAPAGQGLLPTQRASGSQASLGED